LTRNQAGGLLVIVALLSASGCHAPPPTKAEQDRMARAMARVEAEQAESDRTLPARNAANDRQAVTADQQAN
jgi:hypothetical protein